MDESLCITSQSQEPLNALMFFGIGHWMIASIFRESIYTPCSEMIAHLSPPKFTFFSVHEKLLLLERL